MKKLLVIVVTYNAMSWIDKCLGSVLGASLKSDLFVIDNGSKDGTIEHIKNKYPQIKFHESKSNLGFGKANNIGLQYAIDKGYDYVYLLNQDAWVMNDTFNVLINIVKSNPEIGIISPLQVQANMRKLDVNYNTGVLSYESCPKILSDALLGKLSDWYYVKDVMAAHWLISRECLLRIGGFSPSFPHYGEDINYLERVLYHGMKIAIATKTIGVHDREYRTETVKKQMYLDYIRFIKDLSSPFEYSENKRGRYLRILLFDVIKYHSIAPIKYLLKILFEMKKIQAYREISINQYTAFLNEKN